MNKISFLLISLCAGCATRNTDALNSWIGHKEADIILAKGPPNETASDGDGGRVLIWVSGQRVVHTYQPGFPLGGGYYSPGTVTSRAIQHSTMFYVHPDGTIYYWKLQ